MQFVEVKHETVHENKPQLEALAADRVFESIENEVVSKTTDGRRRGILNSTESLHDHRLAWRRNIVVGGRRATTEGPFSQWAKIVSVTGVKRV